MRDIQLIKLLQKNTYVKMSKLSEAFSLSEKSIGNMIKSINDDVEKNGFRIKNKRNRGYYILVEEVDKYNNFLNSIKNEHVLDVYNAEKRIRLILFFLLQRRGYVTLDSVADYIQVSKSTIIRDIKSVEDTLRRDNLQLDKRPNHGVRIIGEEVDLRKAFSKYVIHSDFTTYIEDTLFTIKDLSKKNDLESFILKEFEKYGLEISDFALSNLIDHIAILIYRTMNGNQLLEASINYTIGIEKEIFTITSQICRWIDKVFVLDINDIEKQFLAIHINCRISNNNLSNSTITHEIKKVIQNILYFLDSELNTKFVTDHVLIESLTVHMYPLLTRIQNNIHLSNPLIDEVYIKYSYVFLIGLKFSNEIEQKYKFKLSIDEIGYITLHFAAHFERERNKNFLKYKRIIAVCSTSGGSAQLVRMRLESEFSNASIHTVSENGLADSLNYNPDLIITTIDLKERPHLKVPVIKVKPIIDDKELMNIKNELSLISLVKKRNNQLTAVNSLLSLFEEKYFHKNLELDYMDAITYMADKMITNGDANLEYKQSVLDREKNITTIYGNGVAGPHPLNLNSKKDIVSVGILKKESRYEGRNVQIIFLMNLQSTNLFLHKEISKLILMIIEDNNLKERIINSYSYYDFIEVLENILN